MPEILFLNKAPPYRNTGAESVIWEVGTHLATNGWEVHYLTPDDGSPPVKDRIHFHEVQTPDSFFAEKGVFFIKGVPAYRHLVKDINPDLIYDNSSPFPFVYAHLADSDRLVTKVHAVYGLDAFRNKDHPVTKIGTVVGEQLYRLLDGRRTLTISESTKSRLTDLVDKYPNAITVVPNGIDIESFDYSFSPEGPVLSLCELTPRKNIQMLLRAWAMLEDKSILDNRSLIIAGKGPRKSKLQALANRLNLNSVTFLGYVTEEEKRRLFRNAYVYVLPTRLEGFGISNIEAMASGCIAISTDTLGVRDYIEDGRNGFLVSPENPAELSKVLEKVLSNPETWINVAMAARSTAEEYNIADCVEVERKILEEFAETGLASKE